MLIPTGVTYLATVQDVVWKIVPCERCGETYGYRLEVTASGAGSSFLFLNTEGAQGNAAAEAIANLHRKAERAVVPVPCPVCGWYQQNMVQALRRQKSHWTQLVGALVLGLAGGLLLLDELGGWALPAAVAATGVALLVTGFVLIWRRNPNAGDPEERKQLGRSQAAWGDTLARLLKEAQATEDTPPEE